MAASYQELIAWQKAVALVSDIYRPTQRFPKDEIYGLTSQMRRAVVSIPSNIAEGQGRGTKGEFIQFLGHAFGSLLELETQITLSQNWEYIVAKDADNTLNRTAELGKNVGGLRGSLSRNLKHETGNS